jgi:hypothetical protein
MDAYEHWIAMRISSRDESDQEEHIAGGKNEKERGKWNYLFVHGG